MLWAIIFPLIFLGLSALLFSGGIDDSAVEQNIAIMTCPLPAGSGLYNSSGTFIYDNGTYNYPDVGTQTLTLTCSNIHTLDGVDYYFGQPTVAIGVFFYAVDYISKIFENVGAFFALISVFLGASIPVDLITEVPLLAIPYAGIFVTLGYGILRSLPFIGGS